MRFPITDSLARPVLMLDAAGRMAGVADSEPFGHVNRVALHAGTLHPYPDSYSVVLAHLSQPTQSQTERVRMRVLFQLLDTEADTGVAELVIRTRVRCWRVSLELARDASCPSGFLLRRGAWRCAPLRRHGMEVPLSGGWGR